MSRILLLSLVLFITYSGNINSQNRVKSTAFIEAVVRGDLKEVKTLIKKGANLNDTDKYGNPALIVSYKEYQKLQRKAKKDFDIYKSEITNYLNITKLLITEGVNPNITDNQGNPLIILAFNNGDKKLVKTLIKKGANPNATDNQGNPLIVLAFKNGDEKLIKTLVKTQKQQAINEIKALSKR